MKRKQAKFRIKLFYAMLIGPAVLWLILSLTGVAKKIDTDTGENRNKHSISSDANLGNITSEIEEYYDDRVPFRSVLLNIHKNLNYLMELPYEKAIKPGLLKIANASMKDTEEETPYKEVATPTPVPADSNTPADETVPQAQPTEVPQPYYETPSESGYYPLTILGGSVIQGRDGWLYRDEELKDTEGQTLRSDQDLNYVTNLMVEVRDKCTAHGASLYYFIVPNKATAYPEYMPSVDFAEGSGTDQLLSNVQNNTDLYMNYLKDEILPKKSYGRLYQRTDTHWNSRGAMAALSAIHDALGLEPLDITTIPYNTAEIEPGDLVGMAGLPLSSIAPDDDAEYMYKTGNASTLVRGLDDVIDEYVTTPIDGSTDSLDGRTCLIIGDSYRHHLVPLVAKDFAHTYCLNQDQISDNPETISLIEQADLVIFLMVERNVQPGEKFQPALESLSAVLG